jgi:type I restriction enzyme M protein
MHMNLVLGISFPDLDNHADSEHSWTVSRDEIERRNFDLKAVNPNVIAQEDTRTVDDPLDLIDQKGREVAEALAKLRNLR